MRRSLIWIFASALFTGGLGYLALQLYLGWGGSSSPVPIKIIVQTGPQCEALQTTYLAELMELAADKPTPSKEFNCQKAAAKLRSSPVIKEADVSLLRPGIVYVDYAVRQPVAFLADCPNTAIDEVGTPFPLSPFFPPKNLPEIFLGLKEAPEWNRSLKNDKLKVAFQILDLFQDPAFEGPFILRRVDVSRALERSYGTREIVLVIEDEIKKEKEVRWMIPRILRLSAKDYSQELANFLKLRLTLLEKEQSLCPEPKGHQTLLYCPRKVIDLRLSDLAFVQEKSTTEITETTEKKREKK